MFTMAINLPLDIVIEIGKHWLEGESACRLAISSRSLLQSFDDALWDYKAKQEALRDIHDSVGIPARVKYARVHGSRKEMRSSSPRALVTAVGPLRVIEKRRPDYAYMYTTHSTASPYGACRNYLASK
jgi:hypothetical protein